MNRRESAHVVTMVDAVVASMMRRRMEHASRSIAERAPGTISGTPYVECTVWSPFASTMSPPR